MDAPEQPQGADAAAPNLNQSISVRVLLMTFLMGRLKSSKNANLARADYQAACDHLRKQHPGLTGEPISLRARIHYAEHTLLYAAEWVQYQTRFNRDKSTCADRLRAEKDGTWKGNAQSAAFTPIFDAYKALVDQEAPSVTGIPSGIRCAALRRRLAVLDCNMCTCCDLDCCSQLGKPLWSRGERAFAGAAALTDAGSTPARRVRCRPLYRRSRHCLAPSRYFS